MFEASYLVLGLGDVYLGAPCAVPVNPLHRLVTTKMNPARTFTHEGTVGESCGVTARKLHTRAVRGGVLACDECMLE